MDVLYVVRPGERNEELRYSLRSISAHLPHERVWIVGHKPAWVTNVEHIPTTQDPNIRSGVTKRRNAWANMLAAVRSGPREFVYMDDDHFVLAPIPNGLPAMHGRPLADLAVHYERWHTGAVYTRYVTNTARLLGDGALSYDLHVPMVIDRDRLAQVAHMVDGAEVLWRSVYGNLDDHRGIYIRDVKVIRANNKIKPGRFFSTSDTTWPTHGAKVRAALPRPCRYER